jgi:hypothetical protein
LLNTLGSGNYLLSHMLLQPRYKRYVHNITSGAFLFCYKREVRGTHWARTQLFEKVVGILLERRGSIWICIPYFIHYWILPLYYIIQIQCIILYCTYFVLYNMVRKYCMIQVDYMIQHSSSILSSRLFLDNEYGTIIS